jgi:hypothetical protein
MTELPRRFWDLGTTDEIRTVRRLLVRRFPAQFAMLTHALEAVDPFQIVYPDNPDEYLDVVLELLVLLAPVDAEVGRLSRPWLEATVRDALIRCFQEPPRQEHVRRIVDLLAGC